MPRLTTAQRNALPSSAFLDPKHRKFPAEDAGHAQAAAGRAAEFHHPEIEKKAKVRLRRLKG